MTVNNTLNDVDGRQPPDALLVVTSGCPHCPRVLAALGELVKAGVIGRLEVINGAVRPDLVAALGVKSAPWTRIGGMEFDGPHSQAELQRWAELAGSEQGWAIYFDHLFSAGGRHRVERLVREVPQRLGAFVLLLGDPEVGINTRLGVGVVLEELAGSGLGAHIVDRLGALTRHPDPRLRGDACHYLPLLQDPGVEPYLRERLADHHPEVREIAQEALEERAWEAAQPA